MREGVVPCPALCADHPSRHVCDALVGHASLSSLAGSIGSPPRMWGRLWGPYCRLCGFLSPNHLLGEFKSCSVCHFYWLRPNPFNSAGSGFYPETPRTCSCLRLVPRFNRCQALGHESVEPLGVAILGLRIQMHVPRSEPLHVGHISPQAVPSSQGTPP